MSAVVDSVTLAVADAVDNDCAAQAALKIIENNARLQSKEYLHCG